MCMLIDFDNPSSFPKELLELGYEIEKSIRQKISLEDVEEGSEIGERLDCLRIDEDSRVEQFVQINENAEIAVCHCTRILNEDTFWKNGIVISGGDDSAEEKRIKELLVMIGAPDEQVRAILSEARFYWDRDRELRTECVHFFLDKKTVYDDVAIRYFAVSLGGEILQFAMEGVESGLYKREPYKRLWIWGTPSVIKFKCKLKNIHEHSRTAIIAEAVKYIIIKQILGHPYKFDFTGMTMGAVPPEDIISIEEIKDFVKLQEQYEDDGFYDELKMQAN